MKTSITPTEMIEWFRTKAKEFENIAKTLTETFNAEGQPAVQSVTPTPSAKNGSPEINLDSVKAAVSKRTSARYSEIATDIGGDCTSEEVKAVISRHPNEFDMIGRGWIKLKKV